jgi:hypothetical protein
LSLGVSRRASYAAKNNVVRTADRLVLWPDVFVLESQLDGRTVVFGPRFAADAEGEVENGTAREPQEAQCLLREFGNRDAVRVERSPSRIPDVIRFFLRTRCQ